MGMSESELKLEAHNRYYESARQAEIKDRWARFTHSNVSLLKFEDVASRLHIRQQIPCGLHMVPLRQIVGSVGRYREFTRGFLPRRAVREERWVGLDVLMNSLRGFPPVELYKIGDAYFVIDGNHRISVSRANGNHDIEANVIECQTPVHFSVEDFTGDKWLVKAAYGEFLAQTQMDRLRPDHKISLGDAEGYQTLLQHIAVHRYLANQPRHAGLVNEGPALGWEEAVLSWYDTVYLPVVKAIRSQELCARFPRRSESDLYIAITQYRERVAEQYALAPLTIAGAVRVFAANHADRLVDRAQLTVRQRLGQWLSGRSQEPLMPVGMTAEEFAALRLRHDAGELSLKEAKRKVNPDGRLCMPRCETNLSVAM